MLLVERNGHGANSIEMKACMARGLPSNEMVKILSELDEKILGTNKMKINNCELQEPR